MRARFIALVLTATTIGLGAPGSAALAAKKKPANTTKTTKRAGVAAAKGAAAQRTRGKGVVVAPATPVAYGTVGLPPAPIPLTDSSPSANARTASKALDTTTTAEGRGAVWLAVYAKAGIPVLDASGLGIGTGSDDPIGPAWWTVWMASAGRKDKGVTLTDFARLNGIPAAKSKEAVDALLSDLTAGVRSTFRTRTQQNSQGSSYSPGCKVGSAYTERLRRHV